MKRTYSQAEKEKALAAYVALGPAETARQLGIPKGTLVSWASRAGVQSDAAQKTQAATEAAEAYCAAKRAELKRLLIEKAVDLIERMDEPHIDFKTAAGGVMEVTFPKAPAKACHDYAFASAILLDKFRLESGEVTSRDEHRNIGQSDLDREIDTLMAEMAHREKASLTGSTEATPELVALDSPLPGTEAEGVS